MLHHDRLVGKLDARADRNAGTLHTANALHEDVRLTRAMRADVETEIRIARRPGSDSGSPARNIACF